MLDSFDRFDWDAGNRKKCQAHGVSLDEIETALMSGAMMLVPDSRHSQQEDRFIAAGRSANGRYLFIAFTFRLTGKQRALRPITARYMHRKEAERYEQARTQNDK